MATSKEYKNFILEQLSLTDNITVKPMMGEYLLYKSGVLIGGIYDNRLLLKINAYNVCYSFNKVLPYSGAKPMCLVDDLDDKEKLAQVINNTYKGLI
ncbi:MAG: hypothetical protein J5911_00120 [Clostridia bacterium]|nr:hypothetical protein [Clostridia bacterium]